MATVRKASTASDHQARILRVLVHIQAHLDDAFSLQELAKIAAYSPFHFHRVFRGMVGETVTEHVRRLRLERAAWRLKHDDQPIVRVAFEAGYETHEAFTRAFRARFDTSPSEFRRSHRRLPYPPVPNQVHFSELELTTFDPIVRSNTMDIAIEQRTATRVAFIRHTGPYAESRHAWQRLMAWAGRNGLIGPQTRMYGLSYTDPEVVGPEDYRYDACVTVGDEVEPEGEIGIQDIPGGAFAVTVHVGPYERLGETYAVMMGQRLPQMGHMPGDPPSVERYLNHPGSTEPEELRTEVAVRIG